MVTTSLGGASDTQGPPQREHRPGDQKLRKLGNRGEGPAQLADRRRASCNKPVKAVDLHHGGVPTCSADDRLAREPVPLRAAVLEPAAELAISYAAEVARA